MSQIVLNFLDSSSVLSFYIDVVLTLSIIIITIINIIFIITIIIIIIVNIMILWIDMQCNQNYYTKSCWNNTEDTLSFLC